MSTAALTPESKNDVIYQRRVVDDDRSFVSFDVELDHVSTCSRVGKRLVYTGHNTDRIRTSDVFPLHFEVGRHVLTLVLRRQSHRKANQSINE